MQSTHTFWTLCNPSHWKSDFDFSIHNYPHLINTIHRCSQIHSNTILAISLKSDTPQGDGIYSNELHIKLTWFESVTQQRYCHYVIQTLWDPSCRSEAPWWYYPNHDFQTTRKESDLKVFVWPSIRVCCYEVGEEFTSYFDAKYLTKQKNGKYILNMIAYIADILKASSISDITIHPVCTKCSTNFFSYRNWDRINNILTIQKKSCPRAAFF